MFPAGHPSHLDCSPAIRYFSKSTQTNFNGYAYTHMILYNDNDNDSDFNGVKLGFKFSCRLFLSVV